MACLARLTNWEHSRIELGDSYVTVAKLCKNTAQDDSRLCEQCSGRGGDQSRMLHGLLTEAPPRDSLVYGGSAYWGLAEKYGEPCEEWLAFARSAQKEVEEYCVSAGLDPWLVQRPLGIPVEMGKKVVSKPVVKGSLLEKFPVIRKMYEESDKPPEKLPTDTSKITKEAFGNIQVWISSEGHVFEIDTTGEPGEFMGMMVDGELVESK